MLQAGQFCIYFSNRLLKTTNSYDKFYWAFPFRIQEWLGFIFLAYFLFIFLRNFKTSCLIFSIRISTLLLMIYYNCRMKTQFISNELKPFPYSSDEKIVNVILQVEFKRKIGVCFGIF